MSSAYRMLSSVWPKIMNLGGLLIFLGLSLKKILISPVKLYLRKPLYWFMYWLKWLLIRMQYICSLPIYDLDHSNIFPKQFKLTLFFFFFRFVCLADNFQCIHTDGIIYNINRLRKGDNIFSFINNLHFMISAKLVALDLCVI